MQNGNLTNTKELKASLIAENVLLSDDAGDTELMAAVFAQALSPAPKTQHDPSFWDLCNAVIQISNRCEGSYACVILIPGYGLLAFRDPFGIKPLVLGERKGADASDFMIASESSALAKMEFGLFRDILPGKKRILVRLWDIADSNTGQMAVIPSSAAPQIQQRAFIFQAVPERTYAPDIFEYVYFSSNSSVMDGIAVYKSRLFMGEYLAETIRVRT
jgi:amidophosphoribosyltransferase